MATKAKATSSKAAAKKPALKDLKPSKKADKVKGGAASFGPETLSSSRGLE
jgi:hypothetical protein